MFRKGGKSAGPGAIRVVPAPGGTSSLGPKPPKLAGPRKPNSRDYGKAAPAPMPGPSASPFGPDTPGGF